MDSTSANKPNGSVKRQATSAAADARDKLMNDMKTVIGDAEAWLKDSVSQEGEDIVALRKNFETALQTTKTDLLKVQDDLLAKTRLAAQATDTYVKAKPWAAVGVGAATGLLLGLLLSRR